MKYFEVRVNNTLHKPKVFTIPARCKSEAEVKGRRLYEYGGYGFGGNVTSVLVRA